MTSKTEPTPFTLTELIDEQPVHRDVPVGDRFMRLHVLEIDQFLKLRPILEDTETDADGTADSDELASAMIPFIAASLGGDFDTDKGREYLKRRIDLVGALIPPLIELHTGVIKQMAPEDRVKND
ncbi:MAG: hypothetical protein AAFU85_11575 [Planctomycetota bacterium]